MAKQENPGKRGKITDIARLKLICITIITCVVVFTFGLIIISNSGYTLEIAMDQETKDYLLEHDYCMVTESTYQDTTTMYAGDCQYLNYTLFGGLE